MDNSPVEHIEISAGTPPMLRLAQVVPRTEAEGPGDRFAIWFQGCPLRCVGCCNPEMLAFEGGTEISAADLLGQIIAVHEEQGIEGITLIGGEPFAHAAGAAWVARHVRERGLSVMVFSGYTLEEIRTLPDPAAELLAEIDILVDGPYDKTQPDPARRWVGSLNQQILFLSDRYRADDPRWQSRDTLEIRWDGETLLVNGFPAGNAKTLWKRLSPTPNQVSRNAQSTDP